MFKVRSSSAPFFHGRFASFACCLAVSLGTIPVSAQWVVKTKRVRERSKDGYIALKVDLPILTGAANPTARKAINHELGVITEVDKLQKETKEAIRRHSAKLRGKRSSLDDDNDWEGEDEDEVVGEHATEYEVGLNDGRILSICLNYYDKGEDASPSESYDKGCTFNAETGRALVLDDLLVAGWEKPLRKVMKREIDKQADDLSPYLVGDLGKLPFEFWLSKDGLEISYPTKPVVSIQISYEDLRPLIPKGGMLTAYLK